MNIRSAGWVVLAWGGCLLAAAVWAGTAAARRDPHPPPGGLAPAVLAQTMPTPDRLAAPPTVENPSQADTGAQVYWLNCQPCHGDVGQGLTDEWRQQYPPEDQNCWESNCHGDRPYDSGFTLPQFVPAVVGPNALARFVTAADLQRYMSQVMPFNAPGNLSAAEYWALTAFLMRANGMPPGGTPAPDRLDSAEAAALIGLHGPLATPTPPPTPVPVAAPASPGRLWQVLALVGILVVIAMGWGVWRQRMGQRTADEKPAD